MGIEKFRFVSPGVQVNEIDDSILPAPGQPIGPVVIGNTAKGPAMQPVVVSSRTELERIFGAPSNGIVGAVDVWRTGLPTSPTFATYAASAFLTNAFPITVVRLAGVPMNLAVDDVDSKPGWKSDHVTHIVLASGSFGTLTGSLAANIYHDSATTVYLEETGGAFTSSTTKASASLSADGEFTIRIGATDKYTLSFNTTKSSFIRQVLNTNPAKYETEGFFLGESFEKSAPSTTSYNKVFMFSTTNFGDFTNTDGATSAYSPWVVADYAQNTPNAVRKLFRFVGLNNGAYLAKDIKISIENVKPTKNKKITEYGTFDVVVRKLFETATTTVLERFANLSLDQNSSNYIVKRIGDSTRRWNPESSRYEEDGSYPNISAYVRVEIAPDDKNSADLPLGFLIPGTPNNAAFENQPGISISHPTITLLDKCKRSVGKSTRFGLVSKVIENQDLVDILAQRPFNFTEDSIYLDEPVMFHTRHLSASSDAYYLYSSSYYDTTGIFTSQNVLGFDFPLYGGFDGKDILTKEPFINNKNLSTKTEFIDAEYRAIKQAIDIVAQPELIDMNMLVIPGLQNEDLTDYMLEKCKERGDSLAIIDLEWDYLYDYETSDGKEKRPTSVTEVVERVKSREFDNSYGAAYFPAVFAPSEGIYMPASIAALGAIGGTEGRSALWFAPAGFNRGGLTSFNSGISVSRTALGLIATDRDKLYEVNINPIATFPNEGVVIFGQKTLQGFQSALDRVNVRRLVNYMKKEISRFATKVLFEPNIQSTWDSFKSQVDPFLLSVKSGYGIDDAQVVLDGSTTTADLIDRNMMYAKIYIRPTRSIEYIAIDFIVTNSGASFTES